MLVTLRAQRAIGVKALSNTILVALRHINKGKRLTDPVSVRRSKTSLLKLPDIMVCNNLKRHEQWFP